MPDEQKSMNQLTAELAALRQRLADLETQLVTQPDGAVPVELARQTLDRNPDTVLWLGPDARIRFANQGACNNLGYSGEELLSLRLHDIDPNLLVRQWTEQWQELKRRGTMVIESNHRTREGRLFPVEVRINFLEFEGQEYNIVFARDISQRKRAEQAERLLEAAIGVASEGISITDARQPDNPLVYVNPGFERLTGYRAEEVIGRNCRFLQQDERSQSPLEALRAAVEAGQTCQVVVRNYRKNGTPFWNELTIYPLRDEDGTLTHFVGVQRDITQRLRENEMRIEQERRAAAAAATQAKSAFLANMSHELRTPLNAIIGFTRIVRRKSENTLPEKQIANLDKVQVSAEHLLGLINTILDIAKIEAGRMDVQAATFDVSTLITMCSTTVQPLVAPEVELVVESAADLPPIYTDQEKVRQILLQLLGNAAKFTHQGQITVRIQRRGEVLVIDVVDTGIGMSETVLLRAFEEFQQGDTSATRQYGGTGLGLSLSRSLARLLGGDLVAASTEGVGSTFSLTLPLHYGPSPPLTSTASLDPAPKTVAPLTGQPVVLAIDDDPDVIYLLEEDLNEAGYRIVGAHNGEEGLEKARTLQPFAITLDIMMPDRDGWQVLYDLKSDPLTKDIPVIMLSIIDKKALGFRLGAADYLVKPLESDRILAALERLTGPAEDTRPKRLLVVDDDPQISDIVGQLLEGTSYEVVAAVDGVVALEAIARQRPDVILLDLMMPRLDGFGVIERLRADPEMRHIPVVVLTAKTLTAEEATRLQESAAQVIQKQGLEGDQLIYELQRASQ